MGRVVTAVVAAAFALAVASPGAAREGWLGKYVDLTVGAKGTAGGNVWTKPSSGPGADVGFAKVRGGYGAGGGLYLDARFIKFIGLEMDFLFELDKVWEDITINSFPFTNTLEALNLRIPLLVKGVLPVPMARLALVIGPEFVIPLSTSSSVDEPGNVIILDRYGLSANDKVSTMLTMGFGVVIELPLGIRLPIDLRASHNLTQPKDYYDRVSVVGKTYRVTYQNSWDFRLLLGLGYEF
ncbi:MAG: hypothetical protein FJ087_16045 [Deltaproteobacteria bacterium]|nr:hypothetical protein [Deltaproteobacteria bacterium]